MKKFTLLFLVFFTLPMFVFAFDDYFIIQNNTKDTIYLKLTCNWEREQERADRRIHIKKSSFNEEPVSVGAGKETQVRMKDDITYLMSYKINLKNSEHYSIREKEENNDIYIIIDEGNDVWNF